MYLYPLIESLLNRGWCSLILCRVSDDLGSDFAV